MTTDQFYFFRNGQQIGPVEEEQLAHENITPRTMVWKPGMEGWREARLLPELDFLWQDDTPCNIYANGGMPPKSPPSHSTLATISTIVGTLLLFPFGAIFGAIAIVNATNVEKAYKQKDVAKAERYSKEAHIWSLVGVIVPTVLALIHILTQLNRHYPY